MLGDPDPNVHLNAVSILASFQDEEACLDAAIPLLSWLLDPKWAVDPVVKVPACDPGDFCVALGAAPALFIPETAKSADTPKRCQHVSPFAFFAPISTD